MGDETGQGAEITIEGIVQGVGFREFTRRHASDLGLRGYVSNLADGRVRVVAEGPRVAITALVEQLRRGPRRARVDRLDLAWRPATRAWGTFTIRDLGS